MGITIADSFKYLPTVEDNYADLILTDVPNHTDVGDLVFDPFSGSGVVVAVAESVNRIGEGIEINDKYYR